jgi:hypothetical protein
MIMKYIKYLIIVLFSLSFTGCSENFLDRQPNGVLTDDVFYATIDGIGLGVTGTYGSLNNLPNPTTTLDMMYLGFGSIASDDAEAGGEAGGSDFMDFQHIDQGILQPSGEEKALSDKFWGYNYKTVLKATSTLKGIEKYRQDNPVIIATDAALLNQYEGELNFILAFIHFKMMQVYGGVPIIDHPLISTEYNVKRNTIAECLHFVQERLKIAAKLLPLRSAYPASEMGRATKGAAHALLAKAYLYEASYAENYAGDERFTGCTNTYNLALAYADSVISSNEYHLVGINGEVFGTYWDEKGSPLYDTTPGYRYIFTVAGENSKESIFEIQSINDGLGYMISRGTYLTIYTNARNFNTQNFGWGFNCPTEDLLNEFEPGDPRKIVTIGTTGDPAFLDAWGIIDCKQSPTNMIGRKFEASGSEYWTSRSVEGNGPTNFPYIRYADVVLMAAEAAIKAGQSTTPISGLSPLQLVNMVRKRARNGADTGSPVDLSSVTFEDIVHERRVELALEGHRFFDLVRWRMQDKLVGQKLQNYLNGLPQESPVSCQFTPGKNDFFPIPLVEIINSNYNLVQYPGW